MDETPDWRMYERIVACFEMEAASMDLSVTPNASLIGAISGVKRQIDVLVDGRWEGGIERRIIFDAKRRSRKIDIKDVDSFEGMMRDVQASRGVLVCSNGWTKAAASRAAELIDIRLLEESQLDELDLAAVDPCPHCENLKRKTKGLVFWDGQFPLPLTGWAIVFTGKCDACRSFAFWCWECGEKMVVPDAETYECSCERTWFIEKNERDALFVVRTEEGEVLLDRRPLK